MNISGLQKRQTWTKIEQCVIAQRVLVLFSN